MDLLLKGRGHRVTEQDRNAAKKKLSRLSRMEPRTRRIEIEIIDQKNPRMNGAKRVDGALEIPRKTFRAHAEAQDIDGALDQLVEKLERQLRDHHGRRRNRTTRRSNRLQSAGVGEGSGAGTEEVGEGESGEGTEV